MIFRKSNIYWSSFDIILSDDFKVKRDKVIKVFRDLWGSWERNMIRMNSKS